MRRFVYGWERVRDSGVARERSFFEGTATDLRRDSVGGRKRMRKSIRRQTGDLCNQQSPNNNAQDFCRDDRILPLRKV